MFNDVINSNIMTIFFIDAPKPVLGQHCIYSTFCVHLVVGDCLIMCRGEI